MFTNFVYIIASIVRKCKFFILAAFYELAFMGFGYAQIDTGITIDSQTLEDQTVTLRERDSMQQTRVSLDKVAAFMTEKMEGFVRE